MFNFAPNDSRQHPQHGRGRCRSSSLTTNNYQLTTLRAFTLIELLIVLAIIGLVVALGVPLFGVLTGAKSVEAGRNVVSATLGQARTVAVNEGKYAGVMFFVDPATQRTAMSIVIVTDPASSLEDPDPYDKYKGWVPGERYYSGKVDAGQTFANRGDRTVGLAADADTAFRAPLYGQQTVPSEYLRYFGNYRPTVRAFRCVETHAAQNTNGNRPPRNGPYNDQTEGKYYSRPGTGGTNYPQPFESSVAPFANRYWNISEDTAVSRYNTGEQTLLPRGVGVQLMIQPTPATVATGAPNERYVRTGVIMFDPQGRLTLRNFSLEQTDTLGQYVQLAAGSVARNIVSGVGLALYDATIFKAQETFSESDAIYQRAPFTINAPTNPAFTDFKLVTDETADANPATTTEEEWLDANATPLIIDRYTGSMSEAQ